jgi:hypothetical protein
MDTNTNNYIIEDIREIKFKVSSSPFCYTFEPGILLSYNESGFRSVTAVKLVTICHTLKHML